MTNYPTGQAILTALAAEEEYVEKTGEQPTLLRAHPLTVASLELAVWELAERAGRCGMPTGLVQFRGMAVLEDLALPEGEFKVSTQEEFEAEVLERLAEWRMKNRPKGR